MSEAGKRKIHELIKRKIEKSRRRNRKFLLPFFLSVLDFSGEVSRASIKYSPRLSIFIAFTRAFPGDTRRGKANTRALAAGNIFLQSFRGHRRVFSRSAGEL